MKKETFKFWSMVWAIIWAIFAGLSFWYKLGLGTTATIGGIALMFAWMYEQQNLSN